MADLISRESAVAQIKENYCDWCDHTDLCKSCETYDCIATIEHHVPTVNAVPVVRCRDCKHRIVNKNAGKKGYMGLEAMCDLDTGDIFELGRNAEDPDWFCADGERRDDDAADTW